jgi:shikimate kinase / 3-dehydroquinate synthase
MSQALVVWFDRKVELGHFITPACWDRQQPTVASPSLPQHAKENPMVVVLVGFMGAGKTTVGHIVAERLGQPFVDSDVLIEQRLGRDIRDIFRTEGEPWFRQLEHATVAGLVRGQDAVIALGGGAVEDSRSRAVLRNARVVYLRVSYDEAMARVQSDEFRPMLHRPDLD